MRVFSAGRWRRASALGLALSSSAALGMAVGPAVAADLVVDHGTYEITDAATVAGKSITVDNGLDAAAILKIDGGVTLGDTIILDNGGALDNAGTIIRAGSGVEGVTSATGLGIVTNQNGGTISVDDIGVFLGHGGSVVNTGSTTSINGRIGIDIKTGGRVTNALGASINGAAGSGLYLEGGDTVTNSGGATITSQGAEGIIDFGVLHLTNSGAESLISGNTKGVSTNGAGSSVDNEDGAEITASAGYAVAMFGGGTVTNGAGSRISGATGVYGAGIATLSNAGSISGTGGGGVSLHGDVTNSGTGASIVGTLDAVQVYGGGSVLNQNGAAITSTNGAGVDMYDGGDVTNTGGATIDGGTGDGLDVWGNGTVINSGTGTSIAATGNAGVYFGLIDDGPDGPFSLTNAAGATISGGYAGAWSSGEGTFTNTGAGSTITANSYAVYFDNFAGTVVNEDKAAIHSILGSGVAMYAGGAITNQSGATITGLVDGIFAITGDYTVISAGAGSVIHGGQLGVHLDSASGASNLTNSAGATISGDGGGVTINGNGSITNTGEGSAISGITGDGVDILGDGTVTNAAGATISGKYGAEIDTGAITNTGAGTTISGDVYGVLVHNGADVTNAGGASISGGTIGVFVFGGGTVTNGAGSTISSAATGIQSFGDTTVDNAGTIDGNVWLEAGALNTVILHTGSRIDGDLAAQDNSASTLTLTGDGAQLYSDAVTGDTEFDGALIKTGGGTWSIDKDLNAQYTTIEAGKLVVGVDGVGTLSSEIDVGALGTLGGSGTIAGNVIVDGAVSPGNSPGTLTIHGGYQQNAGSIYTVELDPANIQSDRIDATGVGILAPGASLDVSRTSNVPYTVGTRYTVLHTGGKLTGTFDLTGDLVPSAFLHLTDSYDPNDAYLTVEQRRSLLAAATTPAQFSVAGVLQALPAGNALFTAAVNLPTDAAAAGAFDQLAGPLHPTMAGALLEDSATLRNAALDRLRQALCAEPPAAASGREVAGKAACRPEKAGVWATAFGSARRAGDTADSTGGLLFGADAAVAGNWRLGFFGGTGQSQMADGPAARATSDDYTLGVYGGTRHGPLALRLGGAYTGHALSTIRRIAFPGLSQELTAAYRAATLQAFGEVGYSLPAGAATFEPFANLAYADVRTDGFAESGGSAALATGGTEFDATYSTLGVHGALALDVAGIKFSAKGTLAWRHAFGDVQPQTNFGFAGGNIVTPGEPIDHDAAVVGTGLDLDFGAGVGMNVSYQGQFGATVSSQVARATLHGSF